jgi:hypothetical protein
MFSQPGGLWAFDGIFEGLGVQPHTAAILEKFLLDHPTVERPKK